MLNVHRKLTIHSIEMLNSEPETSTLALCSNQAITLAHILLLFGLKQAGSDESLLSLLLSLFRYQTAKDWQDVGTSIAESLNRVLLFAYICSLCQQGKLLHASITSMPNLQPASNLEGLNLPFSSQGLSSGLPGFPKLGERLHETTCPRISNWEELLFLGRVQSIVAANQFFVCLY